MPEKKERPAGSRRTGAGLCKTERERAQYNTTDAAVIRTLWFLQRRRAAEARLERRIDEQYQSVLEADTPADRRRAWRRMVALLRQRSPVRIARMELVKGLRGGGRRPPHAGMTR